MSPSPPSYGGLPSAADICTCPLCSAVPEPIKKVDIEPIRAFKAAFLVEDPVDGHLAFQGIAHAYTYDGRSSRFRCGCTRPSGGMTMMGEEIQNNGHKQIGRNTSCGFYAMKDVEEMVRQHSTGPYFWILEVDLWGRLIKASKGYRAEKQRVLSVKPYLKPCLSAERSSGKFLDQQGKIAPLIEGGAGMLTLDKGQVRTWSLPDLTAALGVEVKPYVMSDKDKLQDLIDVRKQLRELEVKLNSTSFIEVAEYDRIRAEYQKLRAKMGLP